MNATMRCARCGLDSHAEAWIATRVDAEADPEWVDGCTLSPPQEGVLCRACAALFGGESTAVDPMATWRSGS